MLVLVELPREKKRAQQQLELSLARAWPRTEKRWIVWRPDKARLTIRHNGQYWFACRNLGPGETSTPRFWVPFGEYHETRGLQIAVEINVPTQTNEKRVAGFFAKHATTGEVYLMHDGGLGGGRKGVGRDSFLEWSGARPVPVVDSYGATRFGVIVAPISSDRTGRDVARFIRLAVDFKQAVVDGYRGDGRAQNASSYGAYFKEFAGKKRRGQLNAIEYLSRHGDIVDALKSWRGTKSGEQVVKNAYIDLGIYRGSTLSELYEVKTCCDRQDLYTAIGQILVHSGSVPSCKRHVVLPKDGRLADDIRCALELAGIEVIRFSLSGDSVRIVS